MREVCLELGQHHYLFYFLGLLSCKEYWQNVKIPAEVKTGFFGSACPLCVASTGRAKLLLQAHI